jgi:hypothetical protein
MSLEIVSGALSTIAALEKDEAWLQGWLKEKPARLGLGDLRVADGEPVQDGEGNPAFLATDDGRFFSVSVRLGELEASHGFGLLDSWARNRVRHPDKTHVAVLVTETAGDRYRPTLEALAEHLPLVVVELQAWRGEAEAIIVPHVTLASDDVDLAGTPASTAAGAAATAAKAAATAAKAATTAPASAPPVPRAGSDQEDTAKSPERVTPEDKDDTGVADPWGLPKKEPEAAASTSGTNGNRLLTKFNT